MKEKQKLTTEQEAMIFCSALAAVAGIVLGACVGYDLGRAKGIFEGHTSALKDITDFANEFGAEAAINAAYGVMNTLSQTK